MYKDATRCSDNTQCGGVTVPDLRVHTVSIKECKTLRIWQCVAINQFFKSYYISCLVMEQESVHNSLF